MSYKDIKYNGSGYNDPTAHKAYQNIRKSRGVIANKTIKTLQNVAHLAGFDIVGRLVLRDNQTGEEFR